MQGPELSLSLMDKTAPEALLVSRQNCRVYNLYGVQLRSAWPLPYRAGRNSSLPRIELLEGPDSFFSQISQKVALESEVEKWFQHVHLGDGSVYLRWPGLFEFVVWGDGRRIAGRPLANSSREAFHTYLLGQVLSFALVKRGIEPLHSTAAVIHGEAVAFIGDCGAGKSSLGAAFLQAGYPLLTDDLLVVKEENRIFRAYPGPSRIKLFPEIARALLGEQTNGTPMNNLGPKIIIPLARRQYRAAAARLKAVYVLKPPSNGSRSHQIRIKRLARRDALIELLKNTFNTLVVERDRIERQFSMAALLAGSVPVWSLSYPRSLARLPEVREAILSDLSR